MGDRFLIRLDEERRKRWDAARGLTPLATWLKAAGDEKAVRDTSGTSIAEQNSRNVTKA